MPIRPLATGQRSRIAIAILSCLFFTLCSCAAARQQQPIRPCVESTPDIIPPDPCAGLTGAACEERREFVRRMVESTVTVHASNYDADAGVNYHTGTGEVIDDAGTVLTAYHVVRQPLLVVVGTRQLAPNGRDFVSVRHIQMEVVASDRAHDIVLLRPIVSTEHLPTPFRLRRTPAPAIGDRLWHFGNVSHWQYGAVKALDQTGNDIHGLTEVDFPCRHGDSGGPFVTPDGQLVGVLLSMTGTDGNGTTYFLPLDAALTALGRP